MIISSCKKALSLFIVLGVLILLIPNSVYSEVSKNDIPSVITSGLNAYNNQGADAAVKAWIKGSPYEGSKDAESQANIFRQVETFYGKYIGFTPLHITSITPSIKVVYLTLDYEKGALFAMYLVYKTKDGWILSGKFNFNTEPDKILPSELLMKN